MAVLQSRQGVLAAENKRRNFRAVSDTLCHKLVEANSRANLGLGHGGSAEHVPRLHAVDDTIVSLLVPEATEKDHSFLPGLQRRQAWTEFHVGSSSLGPPMLGMETHAGERNKRPSRWLSVGRVFVSGGERERLQPGQGHGYTEPT